MSSFTTCYAIEDAVEAAIFSVLAAAGFSPFIQRTKSQLVTPRVEVQFVLGASREHMVNVLGVNRNDAWDGVLRTRIVTDRTNNATDHRTYRANVRATLSNISLITSSNLPDHEIRRMQESGTPLEISDQHDQDISEVQWALVVAVKFPSWPTS